MKMSFVLSLACCLLLLTAANCFSAVPPQSSVSQLGNSWYSQTGTWYSINPDQPKVDFYYRTSPPGFSVLGSEYYQNEQTFADVFFQNVNSSNLNYFAGSYLFDNGFFVGASYLQNTRSETTLSPGYRFKVGNHGYAAVSLDYITSDYSNTGDITGIDLDFKLYPEKMKIYGVISIPKAGSNSININANYQMAETLVVGAGILSDGGNSTDYNAGFTYKVKSLVTDVQLGNHFSQNYYQFNVMYDLKKYGLGVFYQKYENNNDPEITLQGLYNLPETKLVLKHTFANDTYVQLSSLAYQMKL